MKSYYLAFSKKSELNLVSLSIIFGRLRNYINLLANLRKWDPSFILWKSFKNQNAALVKTKEKL